MSVKIAYDTIIIRSAQEDKQPDYDSERNRIVRMGKLIRCQNGHIFSSKKYGTICPYCNSEVEIREEPETGKTEIEVKESFFLHKENPVCGWIVCVSGPRKGKDYKIIDGRNYVGRSDDMDIQILGDDKISRRNHCVILYNVKRCEAWIIPEDSNDKIYLNDKVVYAPAELHTYDMLKIGESRFMFVSFCGEHFKWNREL